MDHRGRGGRETPESEHILTRRDVDRAIARTAPGSTDPLRDYPELAAYLASRSHRIVRRLRRAGVPERIALDVASEAARSAAVAALAMHRAIWRDLLPRPGVAGALWSQLPLGLPPDDGPGPDIPF